MKWRSGSFYQDCRFSTTNTTASVQILGLLSQLATFLDDDRSSCGTTLGTHALDFVHHVESINHLAKNRVTTIQPRRVNSANEELGSIGVRSSVRHAQNTLSLVLEVKVLIFKLFAVNGLSAGTVVVGKV